jgi:hypothetical protein
MTQARVLVVPTHGQARRRRLDLALALAMLGRAVKIHERAGQARRALETLDSRPYALAGCEHAQSMGT